MSKKQLLKKGDVLVYKALTSERKMKIDWVEYYGVHGIVMGDGPHAGQTCLLTNELMKGNIISINGVKYTEAT